MLENVNEYMFMSVVNHALIGTAIKLYLILNVEIYIPDFKENFFILVLFLIRYYAIYELLDMLYTPVIMHSMYLLP